MKILKYILSSIGLIILLIFAFSAITGLFGYIPHTPRFEYNQQIDNLSDSDAVRWLNSPAAGKMMDRVAFEELGLLYPLTVFIFAIIGIRLGITKNKMIMSAIAALMLIFAMQVIASNMASSLMNLLTGEAVERSYSGIIILIIGILLTITVINVVYRTSVRKI